MKYIRLPSTISIYGFIDSSTESPPLHVLYLTCFDKREGGSSVGTSWLAAQHCITLIISATTVRECFSVGVLSTNVQSEGRQGKGFFIICISTVNTFLGRLIEKKNLKKLSLRDASNNATTLQIALNMGRAIVSCLSMKNFQLFPLLQNSVFSLPDHRQSYHHENIIFSCSW